MKTTNRLAALMTALSISVSFAAITPASAQDTQVIPKGGTHDSKPSTTQQQPESGTSTKGMKGNAGNSTGQAPAQSAPGDQDSNSNGNQKGSSMGAGSTDQTGGQSGAQIQQGNGAKGGSNKSSASPQSGGTKSSNDLQGADQNGTDKAGSTGSSGGNMKSPNGTKQGQQPDTTGGETGGKTTTKTNPESGTQVQVSVEQQTQIRQVVKEVHVTPIRETDFAVSVGSAIPRKIELEPLPPRIVQIVPQYKAYRFFVLADGRIVIVDPSTFTIVYIIDA
ncbi:DUF1236 domain-containing protein [Agrobacterium rhizogenes]|jgi:hypothetical protein|nr:DUF1236 domain-containing protein [Rhizobium rhizogenes]NTJ77660.1 DUF1236 domain-containing protein [Rhizobium rhizogenes]